MTERSNQPEIETITGRVGQALVAGGQERGEGEQPAARVAAHHEAFGLGAVGQQGAVGGEAVVVGRRIDVLGCEAVVHQQHPRCEALGEQRAVEVIIAERARHETAAMAMEDRAVGDREAGVVVPGATHAAELGLGDPDVGRHRMPVEGRQHGAHGRHVGVGIGEVGRDEGQDVGLCLARHGADGGWGRRAGWSGGRRAASGQLVVGQVGVERARPVAVQVEGPVLGDPPVLVAVPAWGRRPRPRPCGRCPAASRRRRPRGRDGGTTSCASPRAAGDPDPRRCSAPGTRPSPGCCR